MDIEQELLKEHSKRQTMKIVSWIGSDARRFGSFMTVFLNGDPLVTQRAAWVVGIVGELHPVLIEPHLTKLIRKMQQPGVHNAVKRNIVRILQTIDIPRRLLGTVVSLCFDYLSSYDEPIAVKVFAMTVLARAAVREPELGNELRLVIEQQLPMAGGAFRSRAKYVLRGLPTRAGHASRFTDAGERARL